MVVHIDASRGIAAYPPKKGRVSNVEIVTPRALTPKVLLPSISVFETSPPCEPGWVHRGEQWSDRGSCRRQHTTHQGHDPQPERWFEPRHARPHSTSGRGPASLPSTRIAGHNRHDRLEHRFSPRAELRAGQLTDGVLGENDRIVLGAPHTGHRPCSFDENIRTDGDGRNARLFHMNAIVHTARAARASTANGHENIVTRLRQLLNHLRHRGFGG